MIILMRKSGQQIGIDPFAVESIEPGCIGNDSCLVKMKTGASHTIQKQFDDLVHIINVAQFEGE